MIGKIIDIYKDSFSGLSRNVWLLGLTMLINRSGAMVLPFMSLYLTTSLGFTLSMAGSILGAYGAGSVLGSYIGGQLTDRYGHYYVQLTSLVVGAVILTSMIFLVDFVSLFIAVFAFSLMADMFRPANSVAIAVHAKPENRTRSYSLMRFAANVGFSIGPALGGIIAGTLGFKWIFLVDAVTCLGAAAILYTYMNDKKLEKTEHKIKLKPTGLSAYQDKEYLLFIFLVSLYGIAFFQLFTSVPVFYDQEWGFSETKIGLLLAMNGVLVVIFEMPVVRTLEHITRYMRMIAIGGFLMILSFLVLTMGWRGLIPALLFMVFISFSEILAMPFMTNYAISRAEESRRGQYMALYAMAYGVAHIVAPLGSMYLADHFGFQTLYVFLIGLSVMITLAFYSLRKRDILG
ncbi:MAG: MFS transporter [Saprospiraceae bacterium]